MAVNQEMRPANAIRLRRGSFGDDDGIARGRAKPSFQADAKAVLHHPFRAGLQILPVLGLGRDAGEAQIIAQLADGARFVLLQVVEGSLHAQSLSNEKAISKRDKAMSD